MLSALASRQNCHYADVIINVAVRVQTMFKHVIIVTKATERLVMKTTLIVMIADLYSLITRFLPVSDAPMVFATVKAERMAYQ